MPSNEHYRHLQNEGIGRRGALQVLWYFALGGFSATAVGVGFGKVMEWANDNTDTSKEKEKKKVEKDEGDGEGKKCKLKGIYPENVNRYCKQIVKHAKRNNISAELIAVVILGESRGDPEIISASGAVGLMQVMPRDGIDKTKYGDQFDGRPTIVELQNPEFNIDYGTGYLGGLIAKNGIYEGIKAYGPSPKYLQDEYGDPDLYVKLILSVWERIAPKDYRKHYQD